jgi:hypothetical protein
MIARADIRPPRDASMKSYLITTGTAFGLIAAVHVWRVIEEGPRLATEPWFVLLTVAAAALSLWAWRLLRLLSRS